MFVLALLWSMRGNPVAAQEDSPLPRPAVTFEEQQPTFKATRSLVTVDAVVLDKNGHHVTDLTEADFEINVGGRMQQPQQAVYVPLRSALAPAALEAPSGATPAPPGRSPIPLGSSRGPAPATTTRTIAVVVDDLGLSFESTVNVRNALRRFVDEQVRPGDLVAILRTSAGIGALQQFTTDKRLLHAAVDRVQWTVLSRSGVSPFAPVEPSGVGDAPYTDPTRNDVGERTGREPGSSRTENDLEAVRDSVLASGSLGALEFVVRGVQRLPGRKAVIFISEGFELFDQKGRAKVWNTFARLMDRANRAGVVIYTMDGRGLESGGLTAEDNPQLTRAGGPGAVSSEKDFRELLLGARATRLTILQNTEEAMHFLAWQTGGFAIPNSNDFTRGLHRILNDLQGYYLLGYDLPDDAPRGWDPGGYVVRVKREGLIVRSRRGLFGPSDPRERPDQPGDPLLMAALSPFNSGAISVRLTSLFAHDAGHGDYVRSLLFLDAGNLTFTKADDDRHVAALEIVQLAVGDNGQLPGNWRRTLTLRLTDEQLTNARARGIVYSTRMNVQKPGAYQVRTAVRDTTSGAVGSASQFLEVPPVGSGQLAASGVLMKELAPASAPGEGGDEDGAAVGGEAIAEVLGEPAIRIFTPGSKASYAYEIYDGLEDSTGLTVSTALVRNGKIVYESPETPVPPPAKKTPVRVVPIAGSLDLGKDMPSGPYSLQVIVARHHDGKIVRRAAQWVDFEVR
jgi:VWFA-related protein